MLSSARSDETPRPGTLSVLLIEAQEELRRIIRDLLVRRGCSVDAVTTASDALRQVASRSYGLVISEIHLPKMTGIELARHLSRRIQSPRIILTAATSEPETEKEAYLAGATHFLPRPLSLTALTQLVEEIRFSSSRSEG